MLENNFNNHNNNISNNFDSTYNNIGSNDTIPPFLYFDSYNSGKHKKQKNNVFIQFLKGFIIVIIILLIIWCVGMGVFKDKSYPNTYIAGVNVGGFNKEEIISKAVQQYNDTFIHFKENGSELTKIKLSECIDNPKEVIVDAVIKYTQNKNKELYKWPIDIFKSHSIVITQTTLSPEELTKKLSKIDAINNSKRNESKDAYIDKIDDNYKIVPEEIGNQIKIDMLATNIINELNNIQAHNNLESINNITVNITKDYYKEPKILSDNDNLTSQMNQYNNWLKHDYEWDLSGETNALIIKGEELKEYITYDTNNKNFVLDIDDYLQVNIIPILKKYSTVGKDKTYVTPNGKTINLSGGTYGWDINSKKTLNKIRDVILNSSESSEDDIVYVQRAKGPIGSEQGSTFIDTDLGSQTVTFVKNNEIIFHSKIISGNPYKGRGTPTGWFSILEKKQDKVLKGRTDPATGKPSYEQPVKYWMRITWQGVGFHDAPWQGSYTDSAYLYRGSHGCLNMKPSDARELYNLLSPGIPCIVHE